MYTKIYLKVSNLVRKLDYISFQRESLSEHSGIWQYALWACHSCLASVVFLNFVLLLAVQNHVENRMAKKSNLEFEFQLNLTDSVSTQTFS